MAAGPVRTRQSAGAVGAAAAPGLALVVDVPAVKMAYMDGRKTISESYQPSSGGSNEMGNGVDAQGGSITTEAAVELINPAGCGVITNLIKAKPRIHYTKEVPSRFYFTKVYPQLFYTN